ncbi:MAG TPA: transglycosylase domain-containing protein [Acidimicrobiales bacterium]|nr:transglycosylase domain-containing protein [Acidimicrobiales bacterium]
MHQLLRFVSIAVAGALVLTGAAFGAVAMTGQLLSGAASATAAPLAPLGASLSQPSIIYADDGTTILGVLRAADNRKPVTLNQVSALLIHAVLDTEDARFYQHGGVDIPSTLRALASDSSAAGGIQGGSTITQQLVKQTYLTSVRKLSRKVKEAVLAERLQKKYGKNQILQAYLNTIYLGNGAYGVEAAAGEYFGSHASSVTLAEAALLAGMIQDPNGYDPIAHPEAARDRRSQVLARMVHYGTVTQAQADQADAQPLPIAVNRPQVNADQGFGYYARAVTDELLAPGSPLGATYAERYDAVFEGGLKIYTNLDPTQQALAEAAVAKDIDSVGAPHGDTGALAAIEPATGKVRALVGGPSGTNDFDYATQAYRQPGSGFKLFTLLAAYSQGYGPHDTIDGTAPCPVGFPGPYGAGYLPPNKAPVNAADGEGAGAITIDAATAQSINCAYIRLAQHVGLPNVIAQAEALGLTTNASTSGKFLPYPSLVIGGEGVTVLQMADAYATVADDGVYHAPSFIDHIVDQTQATVYQGQQPGKQVVSTQVDRMVLQDLQNVMLHGTGTAAGLYNRQAAGKTGTTDNSVDAWFNGATPQLAASVWMGNPKGDSGTYAMRYGPGGQVFGGGYPAQAWHDFMDPAMASVVPTPFPLPNPSAIPPGKFVSSPGTGGISAYGYGGYASGGYSNGGYGSGGYGSGGYSNGGYSNGGYSAGGYSTGSGSKRRPSGHAKSPSG